MTKILNITSGDIAGEILEQSGVPGEVFVWHDLMYEGPRNIGWPNEETLNQRAEFLEDTTAGGLSKKLVLSTLENQYKKIQNAGEYDKIILWFDACLFDQSMLAHVLNCLVIKEIKDLELICVSEFPGIIPFNGLGQLSPEQMASVYDSRTPVTTEQIKFAKMIDEAFATQNLAVFKELAEVKNPALPFVPAAVSRWLEELPDSETGLGRLESLALKAIKQGAEVPGDVFKSVAAAETPPQYWGDTTLWAKINSLANHSPPFVLIEGPAERLPQWPGEFKLSDFRIKAV